MSHKTGTESRLDDLLASLPQTARKDGGEVSGLSVRALTMEELVAVTGGVAPGGPIYDPYGGTETIQQGLSCDTRNDDIRTA